MRKPIDPRINRTRQLLQDALISLAKEKNVHSISVKELAERARINRATFYLHYIDIADFLKKSAEPIFENMIPSLPSVAEFFQGDDALKMMTDWLELIKNNAGFYAAMLGDNGMPELRSRLFELGFNWYLGLLSEYYGKSESHFEVRSMASFIVAGHLGFVECCLKDGFKAGVRESAEKLVSLTFGCIRIMDKSPQAEIDG